MEKILHTKLVQGEIKNRHLTYYAEAYHQSGRFAHQTRSRKTALAAETEMNNWCKKNGYIPKWRL
jgi:hypothetical protein